MMNFCLVFILTFAIKQILAEDFYCDFKLKNYTNYANILTCNVVKIIPNNEEITNCVDFNIPNRTCESSNAIYAHNLPIPQFPRQFSIKFSKLAFISFIRCGLMEIKRENLMSLVYLREIYLMENQIEVIEENLFEFNEKLEVKCQNVNIF